MKSWERSLLFATVSNMNRDGIFAKPLLEEQEKWRALKAAKLKDAIRAGIVSGPGVPSEVVFERLEKKYATMGKGSNG
jgi:antitoxin ParD1/3/4